MQQKSFNNIIIRIGTIVSAIVILMFVVSFVRFGWTVYLWVAIFNAFFIFFMANAIVQNRKSKDFIFRFW